MKNDMYPQRKGLVYCCKLCTKREIGCHITCEDYLAFQEEIQKIRKKRMIKNMIIGATHDGFVRRYRSETRSDGI